MAAAKPEGGPPTPRAWRGGGGAARSARAEHQKDTTHGGGGGPQGGVVAPSGESWARRLVEEARGQMPVLAEAIRQQDWSRGLTSACEVLAAGFAAAGIAVEETEPYEVRDIVRAVGGWQATVTVMGGLTVAGAVQASESEAVESALQETIQCIIDKLFGTRLGGTAAAASDDCRRLQ